MTPRMKVAWNTAFIAVILVGTVAGAYFLSLYQIHRNDQRWCDTLSVLTSTPVPAPADPKANPSREASYKLYADFVTLRRNFGCD